MYDKIIFKKQGNKPFKLYKFQDSGDSRVGEAGRHRYFQLVDALALRLAGRCSERFAGKKHAARKAKAGFVWTGQCTLNQGL